MRFRSRFFFFAGPALLAFTHCGTSGTPPPPPAPGATTSIFVVPASLDALSQEHFYDHPWPSDFRRDPDGSAHFGGFYNPHLTILIDGYVKALTGLLKGFSPVSFGYYRFTGDIDPATLPQTPQASLDPESSVQLIDVDHASPEFGKRHLISWFWQKDDGVYLLKDTLVVGPSLGYPLRPNTKYALVVTNKVLTPDGKPVLASDDLKEVIGRSPPSPRTKPVADLFQIPLFDLGTLRVQTASLAHLSVFTTNDPTADLFAVADDVHASVPAPTVQASTWAQKEQTADYDVYEGMYGPAPNYQAGKIPFSQLGDGGNFVFDASGKPKLQNTFDMRFTFVVPNATKCPMPASGYPMVLYAHGTGGDYRSVVDEGNSLGQAFAQKCLASMGVDQIFHGTRPGAPALNDPNRESEIELLFFNFNNPIAGRTNGQQSAVDVVQQARLFTDSHQTVPANVSRTTTEIKFDPTKVLFAGHSQGGLNGPLFLAADNQARGGVLSGSGSVIIVALLEKTKPTPSVSSAVATLLQLSRNPEELNVYNPVLNMAQAMVDPTDPVNYVGYIIQHPRRGFAPKPIYQTEGVSPDGTGDSYAPPHGIEIGSVATGLPRIAPGVHTILEAGYSGLGDVAIPAAGLSGNLANGQATGVLAQFVPTTSDGHFVVFDVPKCRAQAAQFERDLADDPKGRVMPVQ